MILNHSLEALIQVLFPLALIVLWVKKKNKFSLVRITIFFILYLLDGLILRYHPQFFDSNWNWDGKICSIVFTIICYFVFKKYFNENNFFRLKQEEASNKKTWLIVSTLIILSIVGGIFSETQKFDKETLLFQFLIPHSDEEPFYRGILLGILMSILPTKIRFIGNPSIFIIAMLFGLTHSLFLSENYKLSFDIGTFIMTGFIGWVLGWLALKSRSILKPIIGHWGVNTLGNLISMIK
jgi:membrane protease YdiL (CAAX protease family)